MEKFQSIFPGDNLNALIFLSFFTSVLMCIFLDWSMRWGFCLIENGFSGIFLSVFRNFLRTDWRSCNLCLIEFFSIFLKQVSCKDSITINQGIVYCFSPNKTPKYSFSFILFQKPYIIFVFSNYCAAPLATDSNTFGGFIEREIHSSWMRRDTTRILGLGVLFRVSFMFRISIVGTLP